MSLRQVLDAAQCLAEDRLDPDALAALLDPPTPEAASARAREKVVARYGPDVILT
jgi:hypothetical protein